MRYAIALVLGCFVTLGVLFTMQALIATPHVDLNESGARHFVDFVRVQREETLQRKERQRDKPMAPSPPPAGAADPADDSPDEIHRVGMAIPVAPGDVAVAMNISGLGLTASDGEYLPIVKIAPVYPRVAQNRGIEGYCLVEYTVTSIGTIRDAKVIDAKPANIFDKVSITAALKFKYRPRVVNGEPIDVHGVRNLFRFELEQ
ncbi:MAG: energy transducer TonB [bacterium]|nr:energy transducer TonB [bacterium]